MYGALFHSIPAIAPVVSIALKSRPACEGAKSRGFKFGPPMERPWKTYTIMKHTNVTEKWVWPVRVTMVTMRRNKAEPPRDKEVKVHLGVELTSEKNQKWNL